MLKSPVPFGTGDSCMYKLLQHLLGLIISNEFSFKKF